MKVVALSGGFGGAKLVRALVETLGGESVTAVVNVGDDLEMLGHARLAGPRQRPLRAGRRRRRGARLGAAGETWNALDTVATLGGADWFRLGDRDLGLHLVRTEALRAGEPLSAFTVRTARAFGVSATLLPATDDELRTFVTRPREPSRSRSGSSPRSPRRGRRRRRSRRCKARAGRAGGDRLGRPAARRAEQSVRQRRSDPRRRRDPRRDRVAPRPVRRDQPARRRARGEGPGGPDARAARRRDDTGARGVRIRGLVDALVVRVGRRRLAASTSSRS